MKPMLMRLVVEMRNTNEKMDKEGSHQLQKVNIRTPNYFVWGAMSLQSKAQKRIALSTIEVEYIAMIEACKRFCE